MSQNLADSIDDMASWDEEMCHENLDVSLPKVIARFEESTFIEDGINMLQLISRSFVSLIPTEELEDRVYSRVCKMVCSLLTDVLNKIHLNVNGALKDTAEELKETITECLQWMSVIVESVERCVRQILAVKEAIDLTYVQSLPMCAVNVLKQTYSHCKESSDLYGHLLDNVGESLSGLFKKAHSLQTAVLALLDKMTVPAIGCEEHVNILCSICSGLFEVCQEVNSLDIKLVVSLWKSISKLCSQHLDLMRDRFEVCPLVSYLCQEITSGYAYLFQLCPSSSQDSLSQGDDKAFTKWVKIVGFQMKVLVALLRDYSDYLGTCEPDVLRLLVSLHRSLPPCLEVAGISASQEGDIRSQITSATLPILNHLIGNRAFRTLLTGPPLKDLKAGDHLPLLLLQLMVLDLLPKCDGDVIDYWMRPVDHNRDKPTKPLVSVIFDGVRLCFLEMRVPVMLPGLMLAGKAMRSVSLYEHVAVHLCGFIGSCLSRHFRTLESTLLENVLHKDEMSSLLAMDAWSFMARFGTAALCLSHVQCLIEVFLKLRGKGRKPLSRDPSPPPDVVRKPMEVVKRLIKFLSPPQQVNLTEQYPPEANLDLWLSLTLSPFCQQVQRIVGTVMLEKASALLSSDRVKLSHMLIAINCMDLVASDPSATSACLTSQQRSLSLHASVGHLWTTVASLSTDPGSGKEEVATSLLSLTRHLVPSMKVADVLQVVEILGAHVGEFSSRFLLACCHFLWEAMPISKMQNDLSSGLCELTHALLTHRDPLVRSSCVATLSRASRSQDRQALVSMCLRGDAELRCRVMQPGQRIPDDCDTASLLDFLRHQHQYDAEAIHRKEEEEVEYAGIVMTDCMDTKNLVDPSSSATKLTEVNPSDGDDNGLPPTKKAKLSPSDSKNSERQEDMDTGGPSDDTLEPHQWQSVLNNLEMAARELEEKCSHASPPEWFVSAANATVSRISDCLSVSASWFDSLA